MQRSPLVLLVDDDEAVRKVVLRTLEQAGIPAHAVPDARGARAALEAHAYKIVILDIGLPDANGLELCSELLGAHDVSIIMLTAVIDESDIVRALNAGADDYVRKPFGTQELLARVRNVLRRTEEAAVPPTISVGPIELDAKSYRARINEEPLPLTPTEYRLLAFLVQNVGRVLTHDQLLQSVWGAGYEGEHHMLHVTMSRLRQKLGKLSDGGLIRTTPGIGYEFVAEVN
ncbi:MAG: response regulator transcription factor [Chloroflexi bacterium]|nr:response regulator transcription factor [Chloroflexota bacterium]